MSRKTSKPISSAQGLEDAWRAFHAEHSALEQPPAGAITAWAYARMNGMKKNEAYLLLKRLVDSRELEMAPFRIVAEGGHRRKTMHFWPKQPAKRSAKRNA